jgi:hypothetical protein
MHTLNEFFTVTKGIEYLIAVTFLIVFPVFWILLSKKKPESKQKNQK